MEFAGFVIPSQAFIHVNKTADFDALYLAGASGIMGLGLSNLSSILETLQEAYGPSTTLARSPISNIFYQNTSLPNFFTLLLGRASDTDDEQSGTLTISEYLEGYSSISDSPRLPIQPIDRWAVLIDGISVNNEALSVNSSVASVPQGKAIAVLDSGCSFPQLPRQYVDALYGQIPGAVSMDDISEFRELFGKWIFPCDQAVDFSFTIGGTQFPVHPLDLSIIGTISLPNGNASFCYASYQEFALEGLDFSRFDMVLGDSFLRNAYASFDYGEFNSSGQLAEDPFVQLLPTTDSDKAFEEFKVVRSRQLMGLSVPSPMEIRTRILARPSDEDANRQPASNETKADPDDADGAPDVSGVLATNSEPPSDDSALGSIVRKYGPVIIGLLAGNLLALLILCGIGVCFCFSRMGKASGTKLPPTRYHPVGRADGNKDSQYMEPVFSRYDA